MLIPVWETKDKQQMPINQMTDSHIQNCIAKIQRSKRGWRRNWLERLQLELEIRRLTRQ